MNEQRLGTILWRGRALIALAVVSMVAVALLATKLSDPTYEATALLRIDQTPGGASGSDAYNAQQASQTLAGTYANLLTSRSFLERISPKINGGRLDAVNLQQRVAAEAVKDTTLVRLSVRESSPKVAEALARGVATQMIGALDDDFRGQLDSQQKELLSRISSLSGRINRLVSTSAALRASTDAGARARADAAGQELASLRLARDSLTQQLGGVLGDSLARSPSVSLAGPPSANASPVTPRPLLNVIAGLLLGSLVGVALAWFRARTDTKLRSATEVTDMFDRPVVGSVPRLRHFNPDEPSVVDAFDIVLANLAVVDAKGGRASITVVTSPDPGDGKSTVALGLAKAAASLGHDVLLVDGDLRGRSLSHELGHPDSPGLSDAVTRREPGWGYTLEVPITTASGEAATLRFLPAGSHVPNPSSLLRSDSVDQLVGEFEQHQLVIIDTPPAGLLPDASLLAEHADEVLVVVRAGTTERERLDRVVSTLERKTSRPVGLVVIEVREESPYPHAYVPTEREVRRTRAGVAS